MKKQSIIFYCSLLQIVGLVTIIYLIIPGNGTSSIAKYLNILVGISGFAAILKVFIGKKDKTTIIAALSGLGLIFFSLSGYYFKFGNLIH